MESPPYTIATTTDLTLDHAEQRIRELLAEQGFGVLYEIDMAAVIMTKLGIERAPHKILGACNPKLAAAALDLDPAIGVFLPCNVIIYQSGDDTVVAAVEPITAIGAASDPRIESIAQEANSRLAEAIHGL